MPSLFVIRPDFLSGGATLGRKTPPVVMIDAALQNGSPKLAAGGTPNAVFALEFSELVSLTGASVLEVSL